MKLRRYVLSLVAEIDDEGQEAGGSVDSRKGRAGDMETGQRSFLIQSQRAVRAGVQQPFDRGFHITDDMHAAPL